MYEFTCEPTSSVGWKEHSFLTAQLVARAMSGQEPAASSISDGRAEIFFQIKCHGFDGPQHDLAKGSICAHVRFDKL